MNLEQIIQAIEPDRFDSTRMIFRKSLLKGGYASDLLSCVMAGACHRHMGHPTGAWKYRGGCRLAGPGRNHHHRRRHAR